VLGKLLALDASAVDDIETVGKRRFFVQGKARIEDVFAGKAVADQGEIDIPKRSAERMRGLCERTERMIDRSCSESPKASGIAVEPFS